MPLRDDLLNPIPGDNPSGANLRYDPITDKIKEARREDLDVPQGAWQTTLKAADYPAVIKMAGDAVAKRSKDLQLAVWLVDAYVHREGFPVLAPCLYFIHDLLEQYWDTLYPPIDEDGDMEVRAAPLVWLGTQFGLPSSKGNEPLAFLPIVSGKLSWQKYQESRSVGYETDADTQEKQDAREAKIGEKKITAEEFDQAADATSVGNLRDTYKQLNESKTAVEALIELCDARFADFSPSFIRTRDAIEEISQTVRILLTKKPGGLDEEPKEDLDDFSVGFDSPAESETSSAEEPVAEEADTSAPVNLSGVARQLGAICNAMRAQDPEDPTPYLILRSYAWGGLMSRAPQIDRDAIEAPDSNLRVQLKRLTADMEWDKVLDITESAMLKPFGRTWFDLQRYATNAIEQKGYASVARVINNNFRILLETLPDILDVTLPDDTPVANPETRNWIENFVIIQKVTRSETPSDSSSETSSDSFSLDDSSSSMDTSSLDTSSFDTSSWDTPSETPSTPEPEPMAEPEPYEVEANPPILEAEEPPPSDTSDEFGMALQAVRDGQIAEGLGIINNILATERSGRQRFRRRTQLAHLLMAAGKGKVAQPLLDQLAAEIEERKLEEWEQGEAIAYPLELLLHCLTSADEERRMQLYTRICRLDPVRGVNCSV